ncbi:MULTISPECIES: PD-(D/E)XK nuclease family protein [unclassified Clostridioides]|uniref:PD-(D/E)XK nuclease family protein n=1 Tax=unclassified Clostridioides TaxID=2635829 RepID=UPI001D1207B7|nr:PD-(D/E)XK nuclease family protein [Clostridioides sp. ES-S-0049-02]MCC0708475.1 PD-(D/E)XK nuclease family protein [Clostridioides sp. ES-S-0190-01]
MNDKLKYFSYSQNSINTYKSCPLKFKYKYIDKINWKNDDIGSREYYDSLKTGRDFHLICERYFSNIPLGIYFNEDDKNSKRFSKWIENIKKIVPIEKEKMYLPEYEVRMNLNGDILQAKYDLIVVGKGNIEIWDWKTESKKINYKNVESRIQTIVYMFLAKEVIPKVLKIEVNVKDISMKYYQPEFDDLPINISYDEEKHEANRNKIQNYINMIKSTNYEEHTYEYNLYNDIEKVYNKEERMCYRNKSHCKYCEFNKLCNDKEIDYSILEAEIYGT